MKLLPEFGYPQTGDIADAGTYVCINCSNTEVNNQSIIILNKKEQLLDCENCGYTYWMKI